MEAMKESPGETLITRSPLMEALLKTAEKAARAEASLLILGETGTGKDVLARWLHGKSRRAGKPFVSFNCASIPETLMESELFGHAKGAFTDAGAEKTGLVEEAEGGTLFLDEIGDLSLSAQPKLLHLLENGEFRRLGENKKRTANIRLIFATNQNLEALIEQKKFRMDLYWRIKHIVLRLPPLRERKEDIPLLVQHFIKGFNKNMGKRVKGISAAALSYLERHDFPGNVRELKNMMHQAMVFAESPLIWLEHLPFDARIRTSGTDGNGDGAPPRGEIKPLSEMEREHILNALHYANGNKKRAAKLLAIPRATLYRKIKEYGLGVSA